MIQYIGLSDQENSLSENWRKHQLMNDLPGYLTPLIGRERELVTVGQLLGHAQVHLLTVTGPGGVGKTRLALQAARDNLELFADGVVFVSLESIADPAAVLPTIARTLDIRGEGQYSSLERLIQALQNSSQLLLLDNFEQVIEAGPELVELLTNCPQLKLLVTSREALGVRGEQEFAVPLLGLPDIDRLGRVRSSQASSLARYPSIALFLERARAFRPGFQPDDEAMLAIAEICVLLNGLPLGLELAAARMKLLSPQAMLAQLNQKLAGPALRLLTGGARDLPARQRTLRQTIQWSYDLLDPAEQQLFRILAIFAGPFTLATAESLIGNFPVKVDPGLGSGSSILDVIASLHNKSLLVQEQESGEPRLTMLLVLREFSREQLESHGELEATQQAHAVTFLALAETAARRFDRPDRADWSGQLAGQHDNLRDALWWALEMRDAEMASRFGVALWPFWLSQGYLSEGRRWLEKILALLDASTAVTQHEGEGGASSTAGPESTRRSVRGRRAELLYGVGILAYRHYVWGQSQPRPFLEESLKEFRRLEDKRGVANALTALGRLTVRSGDFAKAAELIQEALAILRQIGDRKNIATALDSLSRVALTRGEYESAQDYARECLVIYRQLGDRLGKADTNLLMGNIAFYKNDLVEARARGEEAARLFQILRNRHGLVDSHSFLGLVMVFQGDPRAGSILKEALSNAREIENERAEMGTHLALAYLALLQNQTSMAWEMWQQGLAIARRHRLVRILPSIFLGMAAIRMKEGKKAAAVGFLSAAHIFQQIFSFPLPPFLAPMHDEVLGVAQRELGEKEFRDAWAKGPQHVLEVAPGDFQERYKEKVKTPPIPAPVEQRPPGRPAEPGAAGVPRKPAAAFGLTPREIEVLGLVSQGFTDNQVAEQLVISPRTVQGHLRSIYSKLGVNSRTAATRWAIDKGDLQA